MNILTNHAFNNREITVFGGQQRRPEPAHRGHDRPVLRRRCEWPAEQIDGKIYNAGSQNHARQRDRRDGAATWSAPTSRSSRRRPTTCGSYHVSIGEDQARARLGAAAHDRRTPCATWSTAFQAGQGPELADRPAVLQHQDDAAASTCDRAAGMNRLEHRPIPAWTSGNCDHRRAGGDHARRRARRHRRRCPPAPARRTSARRSRASTSWSAAYWSAVAEVDPDTAAAIRIATAFILSKGHAAPGAVRDAGRARLLRAPSRSHTYDSRRRAPGRASGARTACPASRRRPARSATACRSALGMALAGRIQGRDYRVFVVLSDGECNEGSVWEAAMFAAAQTARQRLRRSSTYNKLAGDRPQRRESWRSTRSRDKWRRVRLGRARGRRPRSRRAGRQLSIALPDGSGKPRRHHRAHRQGQGRLVHGRRQQLALPHSDRRGSRTRA